MNSHEDHEWNNATFIQQQEAAAQRAWLAEIQACDGLGIIKSQAFCGLT
jgi:hypothetical protein